MRWEEEMRVVENGFVGGGQSTFFFDNILPLRPPSPMATDTFVLAARSTGMEYTAFSITPSGLVHAIAPCGCTVPEAIERTLLGILSAGKNAGYDRLLLSDLTRRTTRFLQEIVSRSGMAPLVGDPVDDM